MNAPVREIPRAVHLIGVGGEGMAALAHCLLGIGCSVSGSDLRSSQMTKQLEALDVRVSIGHAPSNVEDARLIVVSDAIPSNNVELSEARIRAIPVIRRAECLDLLCGSRQTIMVSGTHGKSTSAAMIATVLDRIAARPSFAIGAQVPALGNHRARINNGVHFVAEACEAFGNLTFYHPDIAVITNVDDDHLSHYGDQERLDAAFLAFANCASVGVIANADDAGASRIIGKMMRPITTFGLGEPNHIRAKNIELTVNASRFDVQIGGKAVGEICLPTPGRHMVMNALACIATGRLLGIGFDAIAAGLAGFTGLQRRWQPYDAAGYIQLVDDFAHHPTEITAIADTARSIFDRGRRIVIAFQPQLFSRTKLLAREFGRELAKFDAVYLLEIDGAGERDDGETRSALIARWIREHGGLVEPFDDVDDLVLRAPALLREGDCLVTAGAGNIRSAAEHLAEHYKKGAAPRIGEHLATSRVPIATPKADIGSFVETSSPKSNRGATVLTLLREQIERYAHQVAVCEGDRSRSFADLDVASDRLARLLRDHGVSYRDVVGVRLRSSIELVEIVVALVKLGAVYLPLDVTLPSERTRFMLDNANARLLVTTNDPPIDVHSIERRVLSLDRIQSELAQPRSDESMRPDTMLSLAGKDLAYICFTSGSTGKPKGVSISHAALANLIIGVPELFQIDSKTRTILNTSISFDVSVAEMWMTLCGGGELHATSSDKPLVGERLSRFIEQHAITHLAITPSVLTTVPFCMLPHLRCIISAGEACPQVLVDEWAPGRQFFNAYGPTETTIYATTAQCFAGAKVNIGKPLRNVKVRVLDAELRSVALGEIGELHIGGSGVADGYIDLGHETEARFINWPAESEQIERLYRTGDLVRQRADGALEYIGRMDNQVKILGNRVELEEIEQAIRRDSSVVDALVCLDESSSGKRLIAFVVLKTDDEFDWASLRERLALWLPRHMVPSDCVPINEIPLTSSGKRDRKRLLYTYRGRALRLRDYCGPTNDVESKLAAIWKSLFEAEVEIGINEDFAWLGGDSLKSLQLVLEAEKVFGITVPPGYFGRFTTIHRMSLQIADLLASSSTLDRSSPSTGFRSSRVYKQLRDLTMGWSGSRAKPDSIIVSVGSAAPIYDLFLCLQLEIELHSIAEHLGPEFRVHGMRSGHLVMDYTPEATAALCEHYIEELEAIRPSGRLLIGGICQGGIISATMANLMRERGQDVLLLLLLEQSRLIPYDGEVAFFYAEDSFFNPYQRFASNITRYEQIYGKRFSIDVIPGKQHHDMHLPPRVQIFARQLRARIKQLSEAVSQVNSPREFDLSIANQRRAVNGCTSALVATSDNLATLGERTESLTATMDELVRLREQLGRSEAERTKLQSNIAALQSELARVYASKSWRSSQRLKFMAAPAISMAGMAGRHLKRLVAHLADVTLIEASPFFDKQDSDVTLIEASPYFDKQYYIHQARRRSHVAKAPAHHYARIGWRKGLNPGPLFNTSNYLSRNPDVATAGLNPLVHFLKWGMREGRTGWFERSEQDLMAWQRDLIEKPDEALRLTTVRHKRWPVLHRGDTVVVHAHSRGHFVFHQFQQMLEQAFTAAGVNCVSADERSCSERHPTALRIVVAPHDFFYLEGSPSVDAKEFANFVPLNSEQMASFWFAKALPFILRAPFTLDINVQTAASLVRLGIDARFLPFGMVPENEIFQLQPVLPDEVAVRWLPPAAVAAPIAIDAALETRGIDVLMIGSNSPRRHRFLAEHNGFFASRDCFIRLVQVVGALARSNPQAISPRAFAGLAQRSKILLNVHHFDTPYFEWQRLMHYGLMQCCCVVTERSSRVPGIIPGEHYFEDELNKLPALMEWLLNDNDGRRRMDAVRRAGYQAAVSQFQLRRSLCELFGLPRGNV